MDYCDLFRRIAFRYQPLLDCLSIHHNPVGKATNDLLRPSLQRSPQFSSISNRCHDDRDTRKAGSRNGKHIGIKAIGVEDLNAIPSEMPGEFALLFERAWVEQALNLVFQDRDSARFDFLQEVSPAS